jgi:type VI protein secretion system component VasK
MKLRLLLAAVWLGTALWIFVADPPTIRERFGEQTALVGAIALMLAVWNVVRWWGYESERRRRQAEAEEERRREREHRRREPEEEPNPDFQFNDPPERPPSA